MTYPGRGANCLESLLKADGVLVSFVTIQKILAREGLGRHHDRWLTIEEQPSELRR